MPTDTTDLEREVVAVTRRIQAVERSLSEHRVPLHIEGDASVWLDAERDRLNDLYVALCNRWLETGR